MRRKPLLRSLSLWMAVGVLALVGSCTSNSPTEPSRTPAPPPNTGGGAATYNVTVTLNPGQIPAGATDPVTVTVRATRTDNGQVAPNGTLAVVSVLQGHLGTATGETSVTIELNGGTGSVLYYPPADAEGSLLVQASVAGSVGQASLDIEGTATFFISYVDPSFGSPQGGDTVTIHGSGFDTPARVTFGGSNARVLSVNPGSIRVVTPAAANKTAQTTVPVSVTINVNEAEQATDTLSGAFTYTPGGNQPDQPAVYSITPTSGPNEGGTQVSIIGAGFQAPVEVDFCNGDCVAATVQSVSSGRIEVVSPPATGFGAVLRNSAVEVRVRNVNSGLSAVSPLDFRYGIGLTVTGLSPDVVDADDPGLVTIFGEGFESPLLVLANGTSQQVVSVSGTEIVFRPSAITVNGCPEPGAVVASRNISVRLLNTNTETASPVALKYTANVPHPQLTGLSPTSGPEAGNTLVTVTGSGFVAPVRVLFGGATGTTQSVGATQVQARTPAYTGDFPTTACTADGGVPGTRKTPVSVDVEVSNLDSGCSDTLPGAFVFNPTDSTCVPNEAPAAPQASFTYAIAGMTVQFTDTSSNATTYTWSFGDGSPTSSQQNPSHVYAAPGDYLVTLHVTGPGGSSQTTQTVTIP